MVGWGLFVERVLFDDVAAVEFDPLAAVAADAVAELEEGGIEAGAAFGAGDGHADLCQSRRLGLLLGVSEFPTVSQFQAHFESLFGIHVEKTNGCASCGR